MTQLSVSGRAVVVTGGVKGIGAAIVALFSERGAQVTVIDLAARDIDVLLPGHGEPVLADAGADIEAAAASFRRLVPPPNVLT